MVKVMLFYKLNHEVGGAWSENALWYVNENGSYVTDGHYNVPYENVEPANLNINYEPTLRDIKSLLRCCQRENKVPDVTNLLERVVVLCQSEIIKPSELCEIDRVVPAFSIISPGRKVMESTVDDLITCVPPVTMRHDCMQCGEPQNHMVDSLGRIRETYLTFKSLYDGTWEYCGKCFRGQNVQYGNPIPTVRRW